MTPKTVWLLFRVARLALWLAAVAYYTRFAIDRQDFLTQFGHLQTSTEMWMFGLPLTAVFMGFMELMMRERAGLSRPALGRDWT